MSGERTEAPTPRKLEQLRDKGSAPRSHELGASIGLLVGCIILQNAAGAGADRLQGLLNGTFADFGTLGRVQDAGRRIDRKFLEDTVLFQNRRFADSEEQVGYALAAADHRGKQSIYELFIHEKPEKPS